MLANRWIGSELLVGKSLFLMLLTIQTSALVLLMRHTLRSTNYIAASVVCTVEVAKLLLSLLMEYFNQPKERRTILTPFRNILEDWRVRRERVLKMALPAGLYAIQNNLSYVALARVGAVTFQVLQQLKILTTALFAVVLLGRKLQSRHWLALLLLTGGVVLVQLASMSGSAIASTSSASKLHEQDRWAAWVGFFALLLNSLSSGFAGVYFERLVKGSPKSSVEKEGTSQAARPRSIWLQSIELGIFGLLFSLILAFTGGNGEQIALKGFFHGYDRLTWLVIGMQAVGGMLVALVVRYADSILKAFAASASIVLSSIISFAILGHSFSLQFLLGATLVVISVVMYAAADQRQQRQHQSKPCSPPPRLRVHIPQHAK